jgi:Nitroreductase family
MMTRRETNAGILASAALAAAPTIAGAEELKPLDLPSPRSAGGQPLIETLKLRRSTREYSDRPLPAQTLSDLLWAAFGVNRPNGDRTAPYWRHVMVMDIYAAMAGGVWLYEPKAHALLPYLKDDIRAATGLQDFVAAAPLNLVYVAHGDRMTDVPAEDDRPSGLRRRRAAQPRLCRAWRSHDGCACRGAPPLRLGRYRLHRPERLSVLRLGGARHGLSGSGRLSEARSNPAAPRPAVRDLRADSGIFPRVNADPRSKGAITLQDGLSVLPAL